MFSDYVQEQLGYYVYRLVDPRDAKTIYIGTDQGRRQMGGVGWILPVVQTGDDRPAVVCFHTETTPIAAVI